MLNENHEPQSGDIGIDPIGACVLCVRDRKSDEIKLQNLESILASFIKCKQELAKHATNQLDDPFGGPASGGTNDGVVTRQLGPSFTNRVNADTSNRRNSKSSSQNNSKSEQDPSQQFKIDALAQYKIAKTEEEKRSAKQSLLEAITAEFDAQRTVRSLELSGLKEKLDGFVKQEESVVSQKDKIIKERLEQLVN